jgi:hypothetical protein
MIPIWHRMGCISTSRRDLGVGATGTRRQKLNIYIIDYYAVDHSRFRNVTTCWTARVRLPIVLRIFRVLTTFRAVLGAAQPSILFPWELSVRSMKITAHLHLSRS